jgi:hypothetical protein
MIEVPLRVRTLEDRILETRLLCLEALREAEIQAVEGLLARSGASAIDLVEQAGALGKPPEQLIRLASEAAAHGIPEMRRPLERALLLHAAVDFLTQVPALPVADSVRHLVCREVSLVASPPPECLERLGFQGSPFISMCRIVRGKRFPAGQHQWELSGFPRSWLARLPLSATPRALGFFAMKARGFSPYFETHLAPDLRAVPVLLEREFQLAFYRMARSLERQPAVRVLMAESWLHSPETHRVSPHLAFMNRPFEEAGGLITDIGPAELNSGFLEGSPARAELYRTGGYKPTHAVALCAREQALAWAAARPQLEALAMRIS